MMVIFVSQCEKKALKRTRRVLDAFADRIGDNTWQTVITEEGLQAVKKLLRKTASKNTAVSCRWLRSRVRSDLLWVVGNRAKFNELGVVAVNRTHKNIVHSNWENNWHYASAIQIIATLAALLHDIGKTTTGFQHKLQGLLPMGDPYRHEWLSLKLFEFLIQDCTSDEAWLARFMDLATWLNTQDPAQWLANTNKEKVAVAGFPPLAQWVAWLIMSHHRLPPLTGVFFKPNERTRLKEKTISFKKDIDKYYHKSFHAFDYWVKNPKADDNPAFWRFGQLVLHSPVWQKQLKRWASKALHEAVLMQLSEKSVTEQTAISDTFLLYTSRMCLMLSDHNYSSLDKFDLRRVKGDVNYMQLAANTERATQTIKQALDEHLLGVGAFAARFARVLPIIASSMPRLKTHAPLEKSTGAQRFKWQNRAYALARKVQEDSEAHGFFGINMASTGCGKTIGNARIMYGLGHPKKGSRFTIALGLRVLTLQTGQSFRENLALNAEQLAILVGGQANKKLFELNQTFNGEDAPTGSESQQELVDEWTHSDIDYQDYAELGLGTVIDNKKAQNLLFTPVVACTLDHLMQASECKRGGRYIVPQLRLLSSDLILDEPDDLDQEDLPALSRLVYLAGLFGSRVLLSSATLTPDLVTGLYRAYRAGRVVFNRSQNKPEPSVVCAWFDEQANTANATPCEQVEDFAQAHQAFVKKRVAFLAKQICRRKAGIIPLALSTNAEPHQRFAELAQILLDNVLQLHQQHHQVDAKTNKEVSIGLIRFAYINNITGIIEQLFASGEVPADTQIHLACYHSRQLLVLRNALEQKLDRILARQGDDALCQQPEIQAVLNASSATKHLFIVMATPVAEVGRDHDYDWAIVEPSSMRSIIQLAGRVWRHRPEKIASQPNIALLQYNLRHFSPITRPVFSHPGFETPRFKPDSYDLGELIPEQQLQQIDARPRIACDNAGESDAIKSLAQLEHRVMQQVMNNSQLNYVNAYWSDSATANRLHTHLQQISPFRLQEQQQEDWLLIPRQEDSDEFDAYYADDVYDKGLSGGASTQNKRISFCAVPDARNNIQPWLVTSLTDALRAVSTIEPNLSLRGLATRYAIVTLTEGKSWRFNPFLGFVEEK